MKKTNRVKVCIEIKSNETNEKTKSCELVSSFNINEISRNETYATLQNLPENKYVLFTWHFNREYNEGQNQSADFTRLARQVLAAKDFLSNEIHKERRPIFVHVKLRLPEEKMKFDKHEIDFISRNLKMIERQPASMSNMRVTFVLPISLEDGRVHLGWIVSPPPEPAKLERMLGETFNNLCDLQNTHGVIDFVQLDKYYFSIIYEQKNMNWCNGQGTCDHLSFVKTKQYENSNHENNTT